MVEHQEILEALEARKTWEERQATWYQMRHDGLRRANKPWPNAADMHFPLVDMSIEKLKPFYIEQLFAMETIGQFTALKPELATFASSNSQWFDYQLKERTNYEMEIISGVDIMLQGARCPVKVYWDPEAKRVQFDAINPLYVIVPAETKDPLKPDWLVHVMTFSKRAYQRMENFNQEPEFIASITGDDATKNAINEDRRYQREGITKPKGSNHIIVWEVYELDENKKWQIRTYSPVNPSIPVRPTFKLPYTEGEFGRGAHPFGFLSAEVKEKGYYAPRGIAERVAPFEASLCKDWNTEKDCQSLTNSPVFTPKQGVTIPNTANMRMMPGTVMPYGIEAVQFPAMPGDLRQSMVDTRMVAEQAIAMPDFGVGQQINTKERKTATEVNVMSGVMGQNTNLRGRIFRKENAHLLKLAWALFLQYAKDELTFFYRGELQSLNAQALQDGYQLEPRGSADNMNRAQRFQKAVGRKQLFQGNPNIDQSELDKSVLEEDDPSLVKRLWRGAAGAQADQMEDQAQEITVMLEGFPAQVRPDDNDVAHLTCIAGFVQRRSVKGPGLDPEQMMQLAQHAQAHLAQLKQKDPAAAKQAMPKFMPLIQELQQQAQAMNQQAQPGAGGAVVPMPPQQAQPEPGLMPLGGAA